MRIRIKTGGKSYIINQPCSIDVLDDSGQLVAAVIQPNPDHVQVLTPGDPKFDIHAAATRTPASSAVIKHPPTTPSLLDQPLWTPS